MTRLWPERSAIFVAIVLIGFSQVSASPEKCRSGCSGTPTTFKYAPDTTYKYNLDGNIDISVSSAEGQQISTKLKGTVLLTQQGQCNQVLRLQNVQIVGNDGKKYSHIVDIDKPIVINNQDGVIQDMICTEPGDTQNSLNVKRAIASLFQATVKNQYETDVFGVCPTETLVQKDGANIVITKRRNLNKCSHRESIKQDFMATAFNLDSEIKSSPLLHGEYVSEQKIQNGILDHAVVSESYLYVPFSVGKNGAKASVNTKIQLVGTVKQPVTSTATVPKSIIFENPHWVNSEVGNVDAISAALKQTKGAIGNTVGEKSAREFVNLVKILRVSNKNDILAVFGQVKAGAGFHDKIGTEKVYLDALFRAGTGDTIEAAIKLLKSKELDPIQQKLVYLGLAFVKHATVGSLDAASTLLDMTDLPREAYLGIGTLAGRYCREHSCKNVDSLNRLLQKFAEKIGDGKASNRKKENEIISVLKAVGNINYISDVLLSKILNIAKDKKAPNRLRVAALEALESDSCKDKIRDSAMEILKDTQQDSEIRIKAYLIIARCPNGKIANALKTLLDSEPSYQVGGFIVSHLRNLRASANPDRELSKQQLGNIHTTKKFPIDPRKYSFNNEFSYSIDTLGLSSAIESNIIYSQKSFMPRSTNLNLTAELFGHTFNFLEIGSRQENLDKILEHYFGPLGLFRSHTPEQMVTDGKVSLGKIVEHFKQRFEKSRSKRDVSKNEIDSIGKQVQIKSNQLNMDLDLDLSVKLFGSELLFLSVNDEHDRYNIENVIDRIFDKLDEGVSKAKNFEHTLQSNLLFLDSEISYPTSMGYPLRLAVEGSSAILLKTSGQLDLKSLMKNPSNGMNFKISLIPSANIEVAGSITIDTQLLEAGLKVTSSMYTATGGDLNLELFEQNKGMDIKFSLPVEKQKLLSVVHEIVFNARESGKPEVLTPIKFGQNKDFSICLDQMVQYVGVAVCADLNTPPVNAKQTNFLPFPLSGNAKFAVGIEREDVSLFHYRSMYYQEPSKTGVEITMETLDENKQKKLGLQVEAFLTPETFFRAVLVSAIKKAELEARIVNDDKEKSASIKFKHDSSEYLAKIGVAVTGDSAKSVFKPLIEYRNPSGGQEPPLRVEGSIIAERNGANRKFSFEDLKVIAPNKKSYLLKGNLGAENQRFFADLTLSDGPQFASLKGNFQPQPNGLKLDAELKNSYNPQLDANLKYEFKKEQGQYDSDFQLIHGQDLNSKQNKLSATNSLTYKYQSPSDFQLGTKNEFAYPLLGFEAELEYGQTPTSLQYEVDFKYGNVKFGSDLDTKWSQKSPGDYNMKFEVHGMDNKMKIKAKREVQPTGDKSKVENFMEFNGKKFQLDGMITHHIKPEDLDIGADLTIVSPLSSEPIKLIQGLIYNPNQLDTHLKISTGTSTIVDLFLKGTKGGNVNGSLKLSLKDVVNANGQIKATNGAGNANLLMDFNRLGRKLKLDSTFTISAPTYNVQGTLWTDFEKDDGKKLVLDTTNTVKSNQIDSKVNLDVYGKKFDGNMKMSMEGEPIRNGKMHFEGDLTLPTEHYFALKYTREMHIENGVANGNVFGSLEQRDNKNSPGKKISLKGVMKNTQIKDYIFDVTYNFVADNGQGKNLNADLTAKRTLENENHVFELDNKIYGSILSSPFETHAKSTYKDFVGSYSSNTKYGPNAALSLGGKFNVKGAGTPLSGDIEMELKTPSSKLQNMKWSAGGSFANPRNNNGYFELQGKAGLSVDSEGANTVNIQGEGNVKVGPQDGQVKGALNVQKMDPMSLAFGYGLTDVQGVKKLQSDLEVNYAKGKHLKADLSMVKPGENEWKADLKLDTPEAKNVNVQIHGKKSPDGKTLTSEVILANDEKKFVINEELNLSEITPSFDFQLKHPDGKIDQIFAKLNRGGSNHFGGELKLVFTKKDFLLEATLDANVPNVEEFNVKATANSPALKLDNLVFEAVNKPAKSGKRIQVSATSGGQNLLSGSTSYKAREENGKYIVEGSGTFKVKEESKTGNFKLVRHALNLDRDGEAGFEILFNAGLGSKAVDAELKISNKQIRILNSYCEEKKQCAHIELDSKTNTAEFNHELEIAIDLRKLGWSHEFGLKGVTNRKNFVLDHTVDVYFQNKENKYQYSLYVHPKEAGASLTTPKRIIAIEGHVSSGQGKGTKGGVNAKAELAVYLDKKNQPQQKTSLSAVYSQPSEGNVVAEVKFTNPALGKDLSVSYNGKVDVENKHSEYNLVIDVFAKQNQKIIVKGHGNCKKVGTGGFAVSGAMEIKSQGLNMQMIAKEEIHVDPERKDFKYDYSLGYNLGNNKYDSGILLHLTPQEAKFMIKALNKELVNANSKMQLTKEMQIVDSTWNFIGVQPLSSHIELKNLNTFRLSLNRQATPNDKLEISSGLIPGQIADFRADIVKEGTKNNLVHSTVKLDETNFLKSDYGISADNIQKYLLEPSKKDMNNFVREIRSVSKELSEDLTKQAQSLLDSAKKNSPNFKPIKEYYENELEKLREEMISDETLKEINEFMKKTFGATARAISELLSKLTEVFEKLSSTFQAQFGQIIETINKEIIPKLAEMAQGFVGVGTEILHKAIDLTFTYLGKLSQIIDAHQAELKQIATSASAIGQEVGRFLMKIFQQAKTVVLKEWGQLYEELKALPITEELKAKYEQLANGVPVTDQMIETFKESSTTIREAAPTEELKNFIKVLSDYIEKKLRKQPVDDIASLQQIAHAAAQVGTHLIKSLGAGGKDWSFNEKSVPLSFDFVHNLPRLVAAEFSPWNYLMLGDWPSSSELINHLSLNPKDLLPPFKRHAVIAMGQHIFTFSERHLTLPGKCSYLYARDAVNGNFSIVGTFDQSGSFVSLTLADKTDTITLKRGGKVLVNGVSSELPVRKPQLEAFKMYDSINIHSKAGVDIVCGPELLVCGVHMSGFYHGQIRGLLGVADNEPYDDWTLPNGKIATADSDFANAYKMGASCPNVQAMEHSAGHTNTKCNQLFGRESNFKWCHHFVNPNNYKTACSHGNDEETTKAIAIAYTASCHARFVPVHVPDQFVQCTNGDKPYSVGDKFSVKIPSKMADIVLVVDQIKSNEPVFKEFVQPFVTQLKTDLNAKGFSDIQFHLIGYGGDYQKYPSHFTSDGQLTFTTKIPDMKFTEEPKKTPWSVGNQRVDKRLETFRKILHDLRLALGFDLQARAYEEASRYPFRANAAKAMVAVTGVPCEQGSFLLLQKLRALFYSKREVALTLVTPFTTLNLKDPKQTKNVIGFNSDNVFTFTDAKKKPEGLPDLHKDLEYDDFCVDFTLKNHGNVFVSNNLLQAKGGAKKQFVQTAAHNLVNQLSNTEQGLDCECKFVSPYTARNICSAAYTKEKAPRKGAHKG